MTRYHWARRSPFIAFASLGGLACTNQTENPDLVEAQSSPVYGNATYAADCNPTMKVVIDRALRFGRTAAQSNAYAQCLSTRGSSSLALGGYPSSGIGPAVLGPYLKCNGDPFHSSSLSTQIANALAIARSPNDVGMNCTGGGGNASTFIGTYGHTSAETWSWGQWLTNNYQEFDANTPWPASQMAGIMWHEAAHTHGYTHGANDQAPAKVNCGYASHPTWNFQVNTMPYIIGQCIDDVLAQSAITCGGNLEVCPFGYLNLLTGVGSSSCSCAPDPRQHGFMILSDANTALAVNAWGGATEGTVLRLASGCTKSNPDCTWSYKNGMILSDTDPTLAINAWGGAAHGTTLKLTRSCTASNPACTWTYQKGTFVSDANANLAINASGGAAHGTTLKLDSTCTPANPNCTWTLPHMVFTNPNGNRLAINAWGGAAVGVALRLSGKCEFNNSDCTWKLTKGMLLSDTNASLAVNAWGGASHGSDVKLTNACTATNPDCTWMWSQGRLISDNHAGGGTFAINAWGGAADGTTLRLNGSCPATNPDCQSFSHSAGD
jgi:hypothetical protein